MFKTIRINNFKGLASLCLNNISYVNLIGGRNNVGKTSLLEALFFYFDRTNPHSILGIHGRRGIQMLGMSQDALWGPIFKEYDLKKPIEISTELFSGVSAKLTIKINDRYIPPVDQQYMGNIVLNKRQIKTSVQQPALVSLDIIYNEKGKKEQVLHLIIENGGIRIYAAYLDFLPVDAVFMASSSRVGFQEDAIRFGKLDVRGKIGQVINFIKETIEPRLISLSSVALESQSIIHAQLEGLDRKIPISYMGDGMARLVSIILAISSSENGYVFLDEVENGIHYSAIPKMWNGILKAAIEYNCQVFATTHSYECLESAVNGIDEMSRDKFRYIRLERDNEKIVSNTFSFEELSISIENEWEVR